MLPRKPSRRKFAMRTFGPIKNPAAANRRTPTDESNLYRQLFDLTHVIKLIIDPSSLRIVEANPAACAFYGYSQAQFTSKTLPDINTRPESEIRATTQKVLVGTISIFQTQHRLASGQIRDVDIQAALVTQGDKRYLYAVIQDITERKQLENALRKSEQLYRLFVQNMPNSSVVMFDTNMRYTLAEGQLLNRLGAVFEPVVGKLLEECITSKEVANFIIPICQRALRGESFSYEREWLDYAYQAHVSPIRDSSGAIIGGMVLAHDITERKHLEAALRASEEQLRLITDNIQDVITQIGPDDGIRYVSSSSRSVLGFTPEEAIGKTPQEFFHPDDWPTINAEQQVSIMAGNLYMRGEGRVRHASGHYIDAESTGKFLYDDQGKFLGGIYVTRDITERKRLEAALRASEERLRIITDNVQDVITQSDPDGHIIYANSSVRDVFGFAPEEMIGKLAREFIHPDDWVRLSGLWDVTVKSAKPDVRGEGRIRHADGHYVDVETTVKLRYDEQSNYLGGIYVTRDVSERKRLEAALRASEEQLRLITDNMQDVVSRIDSDDVIRFSTASSSTVFGFGPEEMIGKSAQVFLHPDDCPMVNAVQQASISAGKTFMRGEARIRHARGHYIDVETIGKLLYDDQGNFLEGIYVARDITERKRLEAALRASEEKFRLIAENTSDGVIQYDHASRSITYASPAYDRLFGREIGETAGRLPSDMQEFIHPDDKQRVVNDIRAAIKNQHDHWICEYRSQHKDGHYFWREDHARFNYASDGQLVSAYIISRDISRRKRLEDDLRASEQRLRLITNNMQDLVILADGSGEIIYVSPSITTVMGYDATTVVGTTPINAIHPDDRNRVVETLQASFAALLSDFTVEMRLRQATGHYLDFETNCRILYDDQQNLLGTVFVARDITERKRLEAALRASEESLRLITDNVQDLILLTNAKRAAVYFSPSFTRVLGHDADFLYTRMPIDLVHPDDRPLVNTFIQKILNGEETPVIIELRVSHHDEHYITFEDVFRPVYDPNKQFAGILHVLRDITNRKQMEDLLLEKQKLQTALDKEQELSTLKTRMMERISHEFRTPLSIIQVANETLTHYHNRLSDEKREAKNATVQNQIRRITGMLDEMALVLRSTTNADHFLSISTNLTTLCREIAAELSTSLALPGKYQLELQPDLFAPIDSAVLRDGLTHIMRNAARFSEPAEPVIIRLAQTANSIELRIIDHGIGIPPDELPRIFEPFFRGSNISERGGLGVGLTIARAAIEAHGGTVRVESELGKGTTFIIGLPA